jgi:hypothetical protein
MLNKLTFQSENLVVDYISFNIPGSDNTESIAKYLFEKFNFNSTFAKVQNRTSKYWFYLPGNQHQVSFRQFEYDPSSKSFLSNNQTLKKIVLVDVNSRFKLLINVQPFYNIYLRLLLYDYFFSNIQLRGL